MCAPPLDGLVETIRWLKSAGLVVAMVTGKGRRSCEISLERYGLSDCFDMVETRVADGAAEGRGAAGGAGAV